MKPAWKIEKIPILQDNFVFILHNQSHALVIDPGASQEVLNFLSQTQLVCEMILITHHHDDHIAGVREIKAATHCQVYVPNRNAAQISLADHLVQEGQEILFHDLKIEIWETPGHTLGHITYWIPSRNWLFSGDVLFALGCGRLFEGTPTQMFKTLARIKNLPNETLVFCTHDYFSENKDFCIQQNLEITGYKSIHPLLLPQEKLFNPFLKARNVDEFADLRKKRNRL